MEYDFNGKIFLEKKVGRAKTEDGRPKTEEDGRRLPAGRQGRPKTEDGGWKLEAGRWRKEVLQKAGYARTAGIKPALMVVQHINCSACDGIMGCADSRTAGDLENLRFASNKKKWIGDGRRKKEERKKKAEEGSWKTEERKRNCEVNPQSRVKPREAEDR